MAKRGYAVRHYGRPRTKKNGRKYKDWYVIISRDGREIEHIRANPNTEAEAKRLKFRKMQELHVGNYVPDAETMTFGEAARQFLEHFKTRIDGPNADRSDTSLEAYERNFRCHFLPRFGHLKLTKVPPLVRDYVDELKQQYEANTVRGIYRTLRSVFTFAHERLGLPDLLKDVCVDLPPARKRSQDEIITFDEFHGLLRYLEQKPDGMTKLEWLQVTVMVCLAGLQGLRVGEIAGTDCEDCDLLNWKQRVLRQLRETGRIAPPKYNSIRDIDHDPITHKALSDYREFKSNWSGPLLLDRFGKRINSKSIRPRLEKVMNGVGLNGKYGPHILRHFAGSLWVNRGVAIEKVSRQLGHKSREFTYRTYIHEIAALENRGRVAMQSLGAALPGIQASLPPPVEPAPMTVAAQTVTPTERVIAVNAKVTGLPDNAPQWMPYAVCLLQQGRGVGAVAKELGLTRPGLTRAFWRLGLPSPTAIRRTNTDKRVANLLETNASM
jgi:integrase